MNPSTLARYRKTFVPSGAKDDPTDAELALDYFERHRDRLAPLRRDSVPMRQLRQLVQERRTFVEDRVCITNRITHALKAHFPLVLGWFRDKSTGVFMDFLEQWPTLQAAQRARRETLVRFFREHNVRRSDTIDQRITELKAEQPLTQDPGVIEPAQLTVSLLLSQLRAVCTAIERLDREIARLAASLPDFRLFTKLPGAGPVLAPRLLVAFGERRERFDSAAAMQKYGGIAPVTERSGTKHWVHWRYACNTFLRQTFIEWAKETIPRSYWAKAFYERHRAKGASHNATLRALAFKWIRILYRCWVERTPYDEARYLNALRTRNAPLLTYASKKPN